VKANGKKTDDTAAAAAPFPPLFRSSRRLRTAID
jgi:hypothetical protein